MFGFSWIKLAAIAGGWIIGAVATFGCVHEYGVAKSQASRDQASYAVAQASATAGALKQQQAIDAGELAKANARMALADKVVANANATLRLAASKASSGRQSIRVIVRTLPPSACPRSAPAPPKLCALIPGCSALPVIRNR